MKTYTIVLIHHEDCDINLTAQGSVWIFDGDGRSVIRTSSIENAEGWSRIVGPTNLEFANQIRENLEAFFKKSGVNIHTETFSN